jgi:hypothetical protein
MRDLLQNIAQTASGNRPDVSVFHHGLRHAEHGIFRFIPRGAGFNYLLDLHPGSGPARRAIG